MSSEATPTITQIKLRFDLSPKEIQDKTEQLIADYRRVVDQVSALSDPTFEDLIVPLSRAESALYLRNSEVDFPQHVSPDQTARDASTESDKKVSEFFVEIGMDQGLFKVVSTYAKKGEKLEGEDARFVSRLMREFKRNGLELPHEQQEHLKSIKKRISELCVDFNKNLGEDKSSITVLKKDLHGLPDDFVKGLDKADPDYNGPEELTPFIVTTKYPHAFPTLGQCSVEETRKRMEFAFANRCLAENVKIAEEVFSLRHQAAKLMGYATWADYILEVRMAKTSDAVKSFIADLVPKLEKKAKEEIAVLLDLKKKDKEESGDVFDGEINGWDQSYYSQKLLREQYGVDKELIKNYFPTSRVVTKTFEIYQELFGLTFTVLPDAPSWHPDVPCYEVKDAQSGELKGFFFLDLHPREGKYGHAAAFSLQVGCDDDKGQKQYPVSAMVCNFPKTTGDSPSLLRHDDFVTFFHEFGHIMHQILGHTKYARFAGTSVERDFVECPSQALENWCWEPEILKRVGEHHETKEPLPDEQIDKMIKAKNVNTGLLNLRQIFFGLFDQTVHSQEKVDSAELYAEMRTRITGIKQTPGTNPTANFGHLLGGYDASYYGYLWAEVFSADVFSIFQEKGIMNTEVGASYRKEILEKGGMEDAENYLKRFLGREPNQKAFLHHIGIDE